MPSFSGLLIVVAVAFAAPFVLGLFPRVRLPSVIVEIAAGIVVGPSVLGWVHVDQSIASISVLGLAFLLFLAGLEIDFPRLKGRDPRLSALGSCCRSRSPSSRAACSRPPAWSGRRCSSRSSSARRRSAC